MFTWWKLYNSVPYESVVKGLQPVTPCESAETPGRDKQEADRTPSAEQSGKQEKRDGR
jgi:hypothetical protein